ncbi:C-C chemokine receptor type 1 [Pseudorasbora parva]|uniref:C-C chemokine receptor type 1 n=1 Tax=Pseudorasbora parva TaxID=51549 RepID=UPI00351F4254
MTGCSGADKSPGLAISVRMMAGLLVDLLAVRIVISVIGVMGNSVLIISILQNHSRLKSFEVFLLGLAVANLEEIVIVDIYDILLLRSSYSVGIWLCRGLKFLTMLGGISSIIFTVVISVYRYQKLRDIHTRVNLPVVMDGLRSARVLSVLCFILALLFSLPTLVVNLDWAPNSNSSSPACPVDFFQCTLTRCPIRNRVYKYTFLLLCNLLPLLIVTFSGCMIVRILVLHRSSSQRSGFRRSTLAILTAMTLFQLNWSVYLVLHLACDPRSFPSWSELEFFITTFYTAISPYVYGIGNNLFSLKRFSR